MLLLWQVFRHRQTRHLKGHRGRLEPEERSILHEVLRRVELMVRNLKLPSHHISHLGRPLRKMVFIFGSVEGVSSSIRRFFEKLFHEMEFGFAVKYTMDLFTQGSISRDEMLERISELERKFNKS